MPIPFLSTPDREIVAETKELVDVEDIVDDIVIFKKGNCAIILESTSLNFGLLSEKEQEAVIASYAALLNSLNFPIQILIKNERKDISSYIDFLNEKKRAIKNQKLLKIMEDYINFIQESIKKKNVLSKRFFIIIPFSQYELGVSKNVLADFIPTSKKGGLPFEKDYIVKKAKISLYPKRDHLIKQAKRFGVTLKPLEGGELIKLFYEIYNPEAPNKQE